MFFLPKTTEKLKTLPSGLYEYANKLQNHSPESLVPHVVPSLRRKPHPLTTIEARLQGQRRAT